MRRHSMCQQLFQERKQAEQVPVLGSPRRALTHLAQYMTVMENLISSFVAGAARQRPRPFPPGIRKKRQEKPDLINSCHSP